jgi:serine/threonine protein kinase
MAKFKKKTIDLKGNKYSAEDILGQGQYGMIYFGKSRGKKITGEKIPTDVAIKEYFFNRFRDQDGKNFAEEYWQKEIACTDLQSKYPGAQLRVIDHGIIEENNVKSLYIVLTLIKGKSLKAWCEERYQRRIQIDETEIALVTNQILIPIARHLEYCHNKGLIHRDLSTENILIINPKRNAFIPVIIDWGAAKQRDPRHVFNPPKPYISNTQGGTAFMNRGTPPEIITGLEPVAASDIYMFGHLMYYLFTGGKACKTPKTFDEFILHPRQENPNLPEEYDKLVAKCTQYEPADRIANMGDIIHILQRLGEKATPSQITGFLKPRTFAPIAARAVSGGNNPQITGQFSPSPALGSKPPIASPGHPANIRPPPSPLPAAQVLAQNAGANGSVAVGVASPINIPKAVAIPRNFIQQQSPPAINSPIRMPTPGMNPSNSAPHPQIRPIATAPPRPVATPAYSNPAPSPNVMPPPSPQPSVNPTPNLSPFPAISPKIAELPIRPPLNCCANALQFAQAFFGYFQTPRWEYDRKDGWQTYYTFFQAMAEDLKKKPNVVFLEKVPGNLYVVGRTVGSFPDILTIGVYLHRVIQKVPDTKVVFLGNYFNANSHDLEGFAFILSLLCMYPNNIILLRGPMEEEDVMGEHGLLAHLRLKFGTYAEQVFKMALEVIGQLDLLCVAEFNPQLRVLLSAGGIPYLMNSANQPPKLEEIESRIMVRGIVKRIKLDELSQSIIWGIPNELADSTGVDSDGDIYFSWSLMQKFFHENRLHYMVRSDEGDRGPHRVIWSVISCLNSASFERNKLKKEAKILRISAQGPAELPVNDLKFYFDRDYAAL